jgi:hypothetical protein
MKLFHRANADRQLIYVLILAAICVPLIGRFSLKPARMAAADRAFEIVEQVQAAPGEVAFVALDFGPSSKAENENQAEVFIEHLMRRRIPIALFSVYALAEPFMEIIPRRVAKRLMDEQPGKQWSYGKDWVNLGYRPGASLLLQSIPKSKDLAALFGKDARGNDVSTLPAFKTVHSVQQVKLLGEFTGLVGVFDMYIQFFKSRSYRPVFVHGCTSITIPQAYIYLDSGQLQGLFEGIAGAAWYSEKLSRQYPQRAPDSSGQINTMLGFAHLVIILAIVAGNVAAFRGRRQQEERR